MNRQLTICILTFLFTGYVFAQNRILKGQIVDENFEPLQFVTIKTILNEKLFLTDKVGKFEIEIAESEKEIEVNYVGLRTEKIDIQNKCFINIVMFKHYIIEFETIQQERKFYKKLKRKIEKKYKKAIEKGILKREENCL